MKIRVLSIFSLLLIYINCVAAQVSDSTYKKWQDNKLAVRIVFPMQKDSKGNSVKDIFNYNNFNADSIVSLAVKSGMRTVIAPAKAGDACLFDTETCKENTDKDIIKELSEACSRKKINFGIYIPVKEKFDNKGNHHSNSLDKTIKKQITELLTKYGKISEISFDMNPKTPEESKELYDLVHKLQPECMVSNDAGNGQYDFCNILKFHFGKDILECCWRYDSSLSSSPAAIEIDNAESDAKKIIGQMAEAVSLGGGFMFKIHLENDGRINGYDKKIMNSIGSWIKENGQAIYNTVHNPFVRDFEWGTVTRKGDTLYLILSGKYPKDGKIELYMPEYELEKADGKLATCIQKNGVIDIAVPASAYKGKSINVLTLKFKKDIGEHQPEAIRAITLKQNNATPHYSISGFDFGSTYKSTVKYSWYFEQIMLKQLELIYTDQEKGKSLEIELDGKTYNVKLNSGKASSLQVAEGTVWGKQYVCGPEERIFHAPKDITTDLENPPVKNKNWKEVSAGKHTFEANPNNTYYVMQEIESPKAQNIIIEAGAGNGIEIYLNGKSIMKHLNPYGCDFKTEKVLIPLQKGKNLIVMRLYNRIGKSISYILRMAKYQTVYKQELTLTETNKKKNHILTVRHAGLDSCNDDMELANLRIRLRRIAL